MTQAEKIARGLQAACRYKEIFANQIAKELGVHGRVVQRYLSGRFKTVDRDALNAICGVLKVNADEIINGTCKYGLYGGALEDSFLESLCWTCSRAAAPRGGGCSWQELDSKGNPKFKPVRGWNAKKTITDVCFGGTETYKVINCPLYIHD